MIRNDPVLCSHLRDRYGRLILRRELVGREGGEPPIMIVFNDLETGKRLGFYSFDGVHRLVEGPMFFEKP